MHWVNKGENNASNRNHLGEFGNNWRIVTQREGYWKRNPPPGYQNRSWASLPRHTLLATHDVGIRCPIQCPILWPRRMLMIPQTSSGTQNSAHPKHRGMRVDGGHGARGHGLRHDSSHGCVWMLTLGARWSRNSSALTSHTRSESSGWVGKAGVPDLKSEREKNPSWWKRSDARQERSMDERSSVAEWGDWVIGIVCAVGSVGGVGISFYRRKEGAGDVVGSQSQRSSPLCMATRISTSKFPLPTLIRYVHPLRVPNMDIGYEIPRFYTWDDSQS